MSAMRDLRDALFELVEAVDISDTFPDGWELASKFPPKVTSVTYPGFWIEPVSNVTEALDSCSNQTTFTFGVTVVGSYEDAANGEDDAIDIADLVYRAIFAQCKAGSPLASGHFDGTPTGQWGFDERYGQRVYRIDVALRVQEFFDP